MSKIIETRIIVETNAPEETAQRILSPDGLGTSCTVAGRLGLEVITSSPTRARKAVDLLTGSGYTARIYRGREERGAANECLVIRVYLTVEAAANQLVAEGYARDDVVAAIDSLIDAGLSLDQPDEGYVITGDELGVLRAQLDS